MLHHIGDRAYKTTPINRLTTLRVLHCFTLKMHCFNFVNFSNVLLRFVDDFDNV